MLIWGFLLLVLGDTEAHGNEEGVSDVKAFDIGYAGLPRGIGRRHFFQRDDGRCSGRMSERSEGHRPERQSLVLSRRSTDGSALLVYRRRRPEGALCVRADVAADAQACGTAFTARADKRITNKRAGARSPFLGASGGG